MYHGIDKIKKMKGTIIFLLIYESLNLIVDLSDLFAGEEIPVIYLMLDSGVVFILFSCFMAANDNPFFIKIVGTKVGIVFCSSFMVAYILHDSLHMNFPFNIFMPTVVTMTALALTVKGIYRRRLSRRVKEGNRS